MVSRKGVQTKEVLIKWEGLPPSDQSWKPLNWVSHHNPDSILEDKVRAEGGGNVTIEIDQVVARKLLATELVVVQKSPVKGTTRDKIEEEDNDPPDPDPSYPGPKATQQPDFCYDF